jgi:hypothetical protein
MRNLRYPLTVLALLASLPSASRSAERALSGWYDIFPTLDPLLSPMFEKPVVGKDDATYSQTACYDMATNLPRSFKVTLARAPEFKKQFGEEKLKAAAAPHAIGKHTAWLWKSGKKLVVPLDEDKAVIFETDPISELMPLLEYAKMTNFDRVAAALANPPRTDFTPTLEIFKAYAKAPTGYPTYDWFGSPAKYEPLGAKGEQRARFTYALKDGTTVTVLARSGRIESIRHETKDGKSEELLKK